jgi:hypothetical protein
MSQRRHALQVGRVRGDAVEPHAARVTAGQLQGRHSWYQRHKILGYAVTPDLFFLSFTVKSLYCGWLSWRETKLFG